MAINVTYQVPASLLQQQRQKERRAYKRQVSLLQMQQNFKDAQSAANRDFQREVADTAYQRRQATVADERAYQRDLLQHKEQREDSLRKQAVDLAQQQQQMEQIQRMETQAWQDSERHRQALEKEYNYSEAQTAQLKQLASDEREAYQQYSQGQITPAQYQAALGQIRSARMGIMPETPKSVEETMSMQERIDQMTVVDPKTGFRMGINSKGEVYYAMPPSDSTDTKMMTSIYETAAKAAMGKDENGNPIFNKDVYNEVVKSMTSQYRYQKAYNMPQGTMQQQQQRHMEMDRALGGGANAKPQIGDEINKVTDNYFGKKSAKMKTITR